MTNLGWRDKLMIFIIGLLGAGVLHGLILCATVLSQKYHHHVTFAATSCEKQQVDNSF